MRYLYLLLLVCGACALQRMIVESTYPDYYEVRFTDGSKAAGTWFCTREYGDAGVQDVLECVDAAAVIWPRRPSYKIQYTVPTSCVCADVEDGGAIQLVACECAPSVTVPPETWERPGLSH